MKVQVRVPLELVPRAKSSKSGGPHYFLVGLLFSIPILVFCAGLFLFLRGSESHTPYPFEIRRFSGVAEVYSHKNGTWTKITRQTPPELALFARDKVRTGPDSEFELKIPDVFDFRLKSSSELEVLPSKKGSEGKELKVKLNKGTLFGILGKKTKNWKLDAEAPFLTTAFRQAMFMLAAEKPNESSLSVLEGSAEARSIDTSEVAPIKALEMVTITPGEKTAVKPARVTYQQWRAMSEVRELLGVKTAEEVEKEIDLRTKAGSFFQYVFDEGTFYKPNWGYANREFYEEEGQVILKADFDVYPQYSYGGLYFKVRGLDLSKTKRLTFNLRATSEKKILDQFRIEVKDRFSTLRGYAVKPVTQDWRFYAFDFNAQKSTPITEVVFVFENSRVGPLGTNGTVYIKDIHIQ